MTEITKIGQRIEALLGRIGKAADGHWSKQPRWPAGLTIGGQFKAWDTDGVLLPPQIGGGKSNPQYQAKADSLYKMLKAGEISLVKTAVATMADKADKLSTKPKKNAHDNWNLSAHEYGKQLLADYAAKGSAEATAFKITGAIKLSAMQAKGGKPGGSNPGGTYTHGGKTYIVKGNAQFAAGNVTAKQSDDRAKNEILATKLLQAAGVAAPNMELVDLEGKFGGGLGVASEVMTGLTGFDKNNKAHIAAAQQDFAVHAWLANYDSVGLSFDNLLMTKDGKAANIDPGGALLFRAQGLPKAPLTAAVTEIDSMRDKNKNPAAGMVYGSMTASQIAESVGKVSSISDATIKELVATFGPGTDAEKNALADKLIERKKWLEANHGTVLSVGGTVASSAPEEKLATAFVIHGKSVKVTSIGSQLGAQVFNTYVDGKLTGTSGSLAAAKTMGMQEAEDLSAGPAPVPKYTVGQNGGVSTNGPGGFTAFVNGTAIGKFPSIAAGSLAVKAHPDYMPGPAVGSATMTTLHNTQPGHNKFYQVVVDGTTVKTVWGKIGTVGQTQSINYMSADAAKLAAAAKVAEKKAKGYEVKETKAVAGSGGAQQQAEPKTPAEQKHATAHDMGGSFSVSANGGIIVANGIKSALSADKMVGDINAMASAGWSVKAHPAGIGALIQNGDDAIILGSDGTYMAIPQGNADLASTKGTMGDALAHLALAGSIVTLKDPAPAASPSTGTGGPPEGVPPNAIKGDTTGYKGNTVQVWHNESSKLFYVAINGQPVYVGAQAASFVSAAGAENAGFAAVDALPGSQAPAGSDTIVGYSAAIPAVPKISSPSNPNVALAAKVANIAAYAQDVLDGKLSPEKGVQAINAMQIAGSNNYAVNAKIWQQKVAEAISNASPKYAENPYKPGTLAHALHESTAAATPAVVGEPPIKGMPGIVQGKESEFTTKPVEVGGETINNWAGLKIAAQKAIDAAYANSNADVLTNLARAVQEKIDQTANNHWTMDGNVAAGKALVGYLKEHAAYIKATGATAVPGATPTSGVEKPKFFDTGFAGATKYYEGHANKLAELAASGATAQELKEYVKQNGKPGYEMNLGKPGSKNGKLINDYVDKLVAAAEKTEAGVTVQAVKAAEAALSQPVANPPKPGESIGSNPAMPYFEKAKLPETNTNASSHNAKIDKLKELADKGDVKGILSLKFGTNNYAKKQVQVANNVLSALGYSLSVEAGQKASSHPALTAGFTPGQAAAAFKNTGQQQTPTAAAHHGPVDNKGKPIVIKADTFPTPPDFKNWNGQGKGLSSKEWANQQNQDIVSGLLEAAKSLDEKSVKAFVFEKLTPEGQPTGTFAPLSDHPSKHTKEFQLSLLATIDDLKNPPEPLKNFAGSSAASVQAIAQRFPAKAHGQTPHTVKKNEQFGFWIALGKVDGAEKFKPSKTMNVAQAAITKGYEKYKSASSAVKKFISGMQSDVTSFSSLYADPHSSGKNYGGHSPHEIAKATTNYATAHPAGTQIYKWINFPKNMLAQIEKAEVGLVFDSVKPMCCSYHPTATKGFGTHLLRITFAEGAKGVDTFGSGGYSGEMEVSTLPHNRFMITGKKWTGSKWELDVLMLPPDPEVYK